jgi:MFS superfamily sulfate permease-like transporter
MEMNRARYKMMQDFLHVVLMGLVVGVLFSMAVSGVVFLLSGHQPGTENGAAQPHANNKAEIRSRVEVPELRRAVLTPSARVKKRLIAV